MTQTPSSTPKYELLGKCTNCGQNQVVNIPRGTTIDEHKPKCYFCGCETVQVELKS